LHHMLSCCQNSWNILHSSCFLSIVIRM
jgi:hypothetical protein